jgi:Protein of unknown function (DUF2948)
MALQLLAQSPEDVPALSALVQDAAVRTVDIHYEAKARRLVLLIARYGWEATTPTRRRAALRFDHVQALQQRGFEALPKDTVFDLLSLTVEGDYLLVQFAGVAALRLHVETIDITLEDFGEAWQAVRRPQHP